MVNIDNYIFFKYYKISFQDCINFINYICKKNNLSKVFWYFFYFTYLKLDIVCHVSLCNINFNYLIINNLFISK